MTYYNNIVNRLDFNQEHNAYSGTLNHCDIDIVIIDGQWSCEVSVDGATTQGFGSTPAQALMAAVA